jgi:hypothetical protein
MRRAAGATPDGNKRVVNFDHFDRANGRVRTFPNVKMRRPVGDTLIMLQVDHCSVGCIEGRLSSWGPRGVDVR